MHKNIKSITKTGEYITKDNKRIFRITFDNYTNNYLYNLIEDGNKQKFYFLPLFKTLVENKGHTIIFNDIDTVKKYNIDEFMQEYQDKFDDIIKAPLIDKFEFEKLNQLKIKSNSTEEQKIKLVKYYFYNLLALNKNEKIDYETLKFWYYNKHLIKNFKNLINIDEYKKTNELQNILNYDKLIFVDKLLTTLNLNDIYDNKKLFRVLN